MFRDRTEAMLFPPGTVPVCVPVLSLVSIASVFVALVGLLLHWDIQVGYGKHGWYLYTTSSWTHL